MNILIACEYSGIVREAFRKKGHNAWSCDLLPTEIPGKHIQNDVLEVVKDGWDMMIAFPPCTYLSNVSAPFFDIDKYGYKAIERIEKRSDAVLFFMKLAVAPIEKICIENPVGHMNKVWKKPDQIIHPYFFGDKEKKKTCLWLKNLPQLKYNLETSLFGNKTASETPIPKGFNGRGNPYYWSGAQIKIRDKTLRAKIRSKTFQGIADAMAEQWG